MTHWTDRRRTTDDRIGRANVRALVVVTILICGAAYIAYHPRATLQPVERLWTRHWPWRAPLPAIVVGKPWVIDGDTIDIAGVRVRLEGIDAPESEQTCSDAKGQPWPCGIKATQELRAYLGHGDVSCAPEGHDRYRRVLAVCSLAGSDVNAWMVRQGWALAYGFAGTYQAQQDEARAAKRGIWAGTFTAPQDWRHHHR